MGLSVWTVLRVAILSPLLIGIYAVQSKPELLMTALSSGGIDPFALLAGLATVPYIYAVVPGSVVVAFVLPYLNRVEGAGSE